MKLLLGILIGLAIGALCRRFRLPSPCPPKIEGALLVAAMTLGYVSMDAFLLS